MVAAAVGPPSRFLYHRYFQRSTILMRSDAALRVKFSDNLAGDKRLILLIINALQQTIAAKSYEKTYNLAGIPMSYIYRNHLTINVLRLLNIAKSSARLSDI